MIAADVADFTTDQWAAAVVAMNVRNRMEDFHCEHLTDAQMHELNPIIRNAIYEALVALSEEDAKALAWWAAMVPGYWEAPRLPGDEEGR
jgi:hypothetical protein